MDIIPERHEADKRPECITHTPSQPEMAVRVIALGGLVAFPLLGGVAGINAAELNVQEHNQQHIRVAEKAERCARFVSARGSNIVIKRSMLSRSQAKDCGVNNSTLYSPNKTPLELPSAESSIALATNERGNIEHIGAIKRVFSALAGSAFFVSIPVITYGMSLVGEYVNKKSKKIASWKPQKKPIG